MTKLNESRGTRGEPCDILSVLEREDLITGTGRRLVESYMNTWEVSALDALLSTHMMAEADLANALAKILKIDRLYHVHTMSIAEEALAVLPFKRARAWQCLVIRGSERADGGTLTQGRLELVLADPTRSDRIIEIKQGLKQELTLSVAERSDIVRAIDELYPLSAQLPSLYGYTDPRREDPA